MSANLAWSGPKTLTSSGWSLCVQWGGSLKIRILCSYAFNSKIEVQCDPWPSQISRIGFPDVLQTAVWGIKLWESHSRQCSLSIQPLSDLPILYLLCMIQCCMALPTNGSLWSGLTWTPCLHLQLDTNPPAAVCLWRWYRASVHSHLHSLFQQQWPTRDLHLRSCSSHVMPKEEDTSYGTASFHHQAGTPSHPCYRHFQVGYCTFPTV